MRRLLPWALLGLLGAGVVVGAVAGAAAAPSGPAPARWVEDVLAATADAGTAHFDYSHVTVSPNPLLHDDLTGSGVVDFTSGDVRVTEVDSQPAITSNTTGALQPVVERSTGEEIGIGRTLYQAVAQQGSPTPVFMTLGSPRDPHAELGLGQALNAAVALYALGGTQRVVRVTSLGPATLDGVATTRYEVGTAPVCITALSGPKYQTQEPTMVWVDGDGRLVQVTAVVHNSGRLIAAVLKAVPALAHAASGGSTTTSTLRFSGFGEPVHIGPPAHILRLPSGSTSSGSAASVKIRCSK